MRWLLRCSAAFSHCPHPHPLPQGEGIVRCGLMHRDAVIGFGFPPDPSQGEGIVWCCFSLDPSQGEGIVWCCFSLGPSQVRESFGAAFPPIPVWGRESFSAVSAETSATAGSGFLPLPQGEGWGEGVTVGCDVVLTWPRVIVCSTFCLSIFTALSLPFTVGFSGAFA
ncbi:Uncharacterised protein [Lelliottia amnigena]|nr:hypothetical protein CCAJJPOJ_02946 [Lelliottia sp. T2.26D-8]VDZ86951.1 Uncharacterised protein [Lelliottia amnigena]